jgi:drug/metabolite transporter (DMT)-like permease
LRASKIRPRRCISWRSFAGAGLLPIVPFFWTSFDALGVIGIDAIGVLGTGGHFLLIRAFQSAPASTLSPFLYVYLVWATFLGWLLFSDVPSLATIAGALAIIASGLYVYRQPLAVAGEVKLVPDASQTEVDALPSLLRRPVE